MTRTIQTFNAFHLGDGFCTLHLLRYLALRHPELAFEFYAHQCHLPEFLCFTEDVPNLSLWDLERGAPAKAYDTWKQFGNFWSTHPLKHDYAAFTKRYYRRLIRQFGMNDPAPGLLFDLPTLDFFDRNAVGHVLFVNSNPCSGQFMDITAEDSLVPMLHCLAARNPVITTKKVDGFECTADGNMKCVDIGRMSNSVKALVAVSTGPSWLCFNTFAHKSRFNLIMAEHEHVNLAPAVWARTIAQAMDELKKAGLV